MKYQTRQYIVEAVQWFKNGDHPDDDVFRPFEDTGKVPTEPREGKVIRYYRHPRHHGNSFCGLCDKTMNEHGFLDVPPVGINVCPGDYVVTEEGDGTYAIYDPESFSLKYERVKKKRKKKKK